MMQTLVGVFDAYPKQSPRFQNTDILIQPHIRVPARRNLYSQTRLVLSTLA